MGRWEGNSVGFWNFTGFGCGFDVDFIEFLKFYLKVGVSSFFCRRLLKVFVMYGVELGV